MNIAERDGWVTVPMTLPRDIDAMARDIVALGNGERRRPALQRIADNEGPLTARAVADRAREILQGEA